MAANESPLILHRCSHCNSLLGVSTVLFRFVFSSSPHFTLGKITPLSLVKLFKPPVARRTISITQKTFLSKRVG